MFPLLKMAEELCYNAAMFNVMQDKYNAESHISGLTENDYIWFYIFDMNVDKGVTYSAMIQTVEELWDAINTMRRLNAEVCNSGKKEANTA